MLFLSSRLLLQCIILFAYCCCFAYFQDVEDNILNTLAVFLIVLASEFNLERSKGCDQLVHLTFNVKIIFLVFTIFKKMRFLKFAGSFWNILY